MMFKEGYKEVRIGPKSKKIPLEWTVNKLKEIIEKRKGKRPNNLFEERIEDDFIPYLSVNYLRGNENPMWCSKEDENKVEVKEEEILMIWDGSYSGNVFINFNGALSSTMAKLSCKESVNNKYLYYQLSNDFEIFQTTTIGTSVPHVAGQIFDNLKIPKPNLKEQKKIADILSSVDETIEKTDQVIEKTKELKKGLMQQLLTKGIGHSEFKKVKIGPKKYKIPKSWIVKKLKSISELITKGTTPTSYGFQYLDEGINFIKVENLNKKGTIDTDSLSKISPKANQKLSRSILSEEDILFSIAGSLGLCSIVNKKILPANTNQALSIIRLDDGLINNSFVLYYLKSNHIQNYIKAISTVSAQPNLSLKQVGDFNISLPPLEEQNKIANILSTVDEKIQKEGEYKSKLEKLKKGLMQKLLTGEVRVKVAN